MKRIAAVFAALVIIGSGGGCAKQAESQPPDDTVCAMTIHGCIPVGTGPAMIGNQPVPFGLHCNSDQVIVSWQNEDMSTTPQCINFGEL